MKYYLEENCARTITCGILDYCNHPKACEVLFKSFSPFNQGLQERSVCGSVIGSLSALSYLLNDKSISPHEITDKVTKFKTELQKEFDTIHCTVIYITRSEDS